MTQTTRSVFGSRDGSRRPPHFMGAGGGIVHGLLFIGHCAGFPASPQRRPRVLHPEVAVSPVPLRLHAEILTLTTRHPFIIARGTHHEIRTVQVILRDADGMEGWGEAAPQ